ncbi:MAG: 2OG-Fe(II) oxygenase [Bdellovibrionales bacterium]
MQYQIYDSFFSKAKALRSAFDERFHDPLQPRADRFIWDYWHVPNEYTLLRTQAHTFFPSRLYESFHRHLVEWGRENLGCHDVSPPWLSCYVEGCRQEKHSDVPHGPLAFVYSLTPWQQRAFTGGETFLEGEKDIPAKFNRLLVFNPSIPHGVNQVRGTHDPRYGRLVIHGWFVNPRPFWYGPLKVAEISRGIEQGLEDVLAGELNLGRGMLSTRLAILPSGKVGKIKTLVNTLTEYEPADLKRLQSSLKKLTFSKRRAGTQLTLPLIVE